MECDDKNEEEEYFPTAPLDDELWLKEPVPEMDLCIHLAPGKSETNYPSWTTVYPWEYVPTQTAAYPQEPTQEQATA